MWLLQRFVCGASLLLPFLAGCGGADDPNRVPTYPVSVKVMYKGAPVEGATVTFINEQKPAFGITDAQGVAQMKTEGQDGAIAGTHKVTVVKSEVSSAPAADQDSPDYVPPSASDPGDTIKNLIPQKYSAPGTTDLTATVSESGPNEVTLELRD